MCGPAKAFRYVLSHPTGKIEVIGADSDGSMIFKCHQAKYDRDQSRIFRKKIPEDQCWLEENDTEGEQNADVSLCTETAEKKIDDEALISLFFDIEKPGRRPSENSVRIILPV